MKTVYAVGTTPAVATKKVSGKIKNKPHFNPNFGSNTPELMLKNGWRYAVMPVAEVIQDDWFLLSGNLCRVLEIVDNAYGEKVITFYNGNNNGLKQVSTLIMHAGLQLEVYNQPRYHTRRGPYSPYNKR